MKFNKLLMLAPTILGLGVLSSCNNSSEPGIDPNWINKENWYELTNNATEEDIGKTATVKVNGLDHLVRLIDIDHDVDKFGFKIHTTWEFANLICDSEGYSLSYQWQDDTDPAVKEGLNYLNSSIRKILCGTGDFPSNNVYCMTLNSVTQPKPDWDMNYSKKSIISMLPKELVSVLKTTKKTVRVLTEGEYVPTEYTDKLFLLTCREIGDFKELKDGEVYKYYYNGDETEQDLRTIRCKTQIKGPDGARVREDIKAFTPETPLARYNGLMFNCYAGCNLVYAPDTPLEANFAPYWLSSPDSKNKGMAHACFEGTQKTDGSKTLAPWSNSDTCGIAPAFCI